MPPSPRFGVLRGPFFGVSDRDLFTYKQAGGWFSIFADATGVCDQPTAGTESSARVRTALEALRQYHRWTRLLPAGAALERILEHTGYLALAATAPGGVEAGDLLHAVDRVRQVVQDVAPADLVLIGRNTLQEWLWNRLAMPSDQEVH